MLKEKIQTLINTKVIQAKEVVPNIRNNPLPDHRCEVVNVIETDEEWDQEGSIVLIPEGDAPKTSHVTLSPIVVKTQAPFEVKVATPFTVIVVPTCLISVMPSHGIMWRRQKAKESQYGRDRCCVRYD